MPATTKKNQEPLDKTPLTFELSGESLDRFEALKKRTGTKSTSALIRLLIEKTNFRRLPKSKPEKSAQFSVRLPPALRTKLTNGAELKKFSVGAAVREALANIELPEGCLAEARTAPGPRPKKKAAAKVAEAKASLTKSRKTKKASTKKAAVKKVAAKKTPAKKVAAKKSSTKKVATKKATALVEVAEKAASKKAAKKTTSAKATKTAASAKKGKGKKKAKKAKKS